MTMRSRYEPKFQIEVAELALDAWMVPGSVRPTSEFIVSRKRDGAIASLYGDLVWDYDAYTPDRTNGRLDYSFWCGSVLSERHVVLIEEIRWLNFCNMWKRGGSGMAISTLKILHLAACRLAKYAFSHNMTITSLLCDKEAFTTLVQSLTAAEARHLRHLIFSLYRLDPSELGFQIVGREAQRLLSRISERRKYEQTAPIPTRLYTKLISGLTERLEETEGVLARILNLLTEFGSDPMMGRTYTQQQTRSAAKTGNRFQKSNARPDFAELTRRNKLQDYFEKYEIKKVRSLSEHLGTIQTLCKLLIHVYSGMRDGEVETLPLRCLISEKRGGTLHHTIVGKTYKFSGGHGKRAKWITGEDAVRAIQIAQQLALLIIAAVDKHAAIPEKPDDSFPLFTSPAYLCLGTTTPKSTDTGCFRHSANLHLKSRKQWVYSLDLIITNADLEELQDIDPLRDWSKKEFQAGNRWPLATHQLRRSLALYAPRSGLVALPSMSRQFQHITQEMALYYTRGSFFATNFVDPDNPENRRHFIFEYQNTAPESEMLAIMLHVIKTDNRLFGGQGTFWQRQKDKGQIDFLTFDRSKTVKEIKNGLRSYRETPLGGCGKVGECKERAMGNVMGCLLSGGSTKELGPKPCKDSYITLKGLDAVIASQERRVSKEREISDSSMYYKEAVDDLDVLKSYRARYRAE